MKRLIGWLVDLLTRMPAHECEPFAFDPGTSEARCRWCQKPMSWNRP